MITFKKLLIGVVFELNGNKYIKKSSRTATPLFECHIECFFIGLNEYVNVVKGVRINIRNTKNLCKLYTIFYNADLPTLFSLRSRVNALVWCDHENKVGHCFLKAIDSKIFTQSINKRV